MDFDAVLIPTRKRPCSNRDTGSIKQFSIFTQCGRKNPDKTALVSFKVENQTEQTFSYQQIWDMTNKITLGLKQLGIEKMMWCLASCRTGGNLPCCIWLVAVLAPY